jgi:hypothetical protein
MEISLVISTELSADLPAPMLIARVRARMAREGYDENAIAAAATRPRCCLTNHLCTTKYAYPSSPCFQEINAKNSSRQTLPSAPILE